MRETDQHNVNFCEECLLQLKRKNELPVVECPRCNHKTFQLNASVCEQSYSCNTCGESCIATYFPPCNADDNQYILQIYLDESVSLRTFSVVGKIFGIKYTEIYKQYKTGQKIKYAVSLKAALKKSRCLDDIGIIYELIPKFPYSNIEMCYREGII